MIEQYGKSIPLEVIKDIRYLRRLREHNLDAYVFAVSRVVEERLNDKLRQA